MTPTTTTERLTLRSLIDVDLPELVALNGDPEAMPFITGRALTPAELEAEHEAAAEIGWRLPRSRWAGASPPRAPGRRGRLRGDPADRAHQLSTRSLAAFRLIPLCSRTTLIAWILFPEAARARAST